MKVIFKILLLTVFWSKTEEGPLPGKKTTPGGGTLEGARDFPHGVNIPDLKSLD